MKDSRLEIRISTTEKRRLEKLAHELGTNAADVLRAGARFLDENRQIARALLGSNDGRKG